MLVVLYSPIPHGVAPQQSSTMLQTAVAKVLTLVQKAKKTAEKVILQFELLNIYYSKSSCKMSYTPKNIYDNYMVDSMGIICSSNMNCHELAM